VTDDLNEKIQYGTCGKIQPRQALAIVELLIISADPHPFEFLLDFRTIRTM
jgi:hypothetical protein